MGKSECRWGCGEFYSLLLEHDHLVLLNVRHVDLLQQLLLLHAQLAELGQHLGVQEVLVAVVRVVGGLECLVVQPVAANPFVNAALLGRDRQRLRKN